MGRMRGYSPLGDVPACPCSACVTLGRLVDLRRRQIHEAAEVREALERAAAVVDRLHGLDACALARSASCPSLNRSTT